MFIYEVRSLTCISQKTSNFTSRLGNCFHHASLKYNSFFFFILLSKMVPLHMSWVKFTNLEVISIFCAGVLNNLKNTIQKYFKVPNRAVYFLWSLVICFIFSEPLFKHTYSTFPTTTKRSRTPTYILEKYHRKV